MSKAHKTIRMKRQVREQRFEIREKSANILRKRRQTGNLKSSLSDNRPEAIAASFQTSEGEHQHAFL